MTNSSWEFDGTQSPAPETVFEDPAAGLVTGGAYEQESIPFDAIDQVRPMMPDMDEVRRAVDAQLASEDQYGGLPAVPSPRAEQQPAGEPPGIVAPNPRPGWPLAPAARQLANFRPKIPQHRRSRSRPIQRVPHQNRSSKATIAGVAGLVAGFIVLVVIVVTIIGSFANTITTLLH